MKRAWLVLLCVNLVLAATATAVAALSWRWPVHVTIHDPARKQGTAASVTDGRLRLAATTGRSPFQFGRRWSSFEGLGRTVTLSVGPQAIFSAGSKFSVTHASAWTLIAALVLIWSFPLYCLYTGPIRRWRLGMPGHCRKCGYDLTGNESGTCPECGTRTAPDTKSRIVTPSNDEY